MIERIDLQSGKVQAKQRIVPSPLVAGLRGVGPCGLVVSPDGSRLFVAESGINAIGVLDAKTLRVLGHIPTAWYPYRLAVSPDAKRLAVINLRALGMGRRRVRKRRNMGAQRRRRAAFLGCAG